MAWFC